MAISIPTWCRIVVLHARSHSVFFRERTDGYCFLRQSEAGAIPAFSRKCQGLCRPRIWLPASNTCSFPSCTSTRFQKDHGICWQNKFIVDRSQPRALECDDTKYLHMIVTSFVKFELDWLPRLNVIKQFIHLNVIALIEFDQIVRLSVIVLVEYEQFIVLEFCTIWLSITGSAVRVQLR